MKFATPVSFQHQQIFFCSDQIFEDFLKIYTCENIHIFIIIFIKKLASVYSFLLVALLTFSLANADPVPQGQENTSSSARMISEYCSQDIWNLGSQGRQFTPSEPLHR